MLWPLAGSRPLGAAARAAIAAASELRFSVVSFAEIGVEVAIGKRSVPADVEEHVTGSGLRLLPLTAAHGLHVSALPLHHRDPFDRLLVSQAAIEGLTLVTADERLDAYDVEVLDAVG